MDWANPLKRAALAFGLFSGLESEQSAARFSQAAMMKSLGGEVAVRRREELGVANAPPRTVPCR
jgi:hypothetical protein